jgi:hypothetical protein
MKRCEGTSNNTLIFVQSQVALINLASYFTRQSGRLHYSGL